MDDCSPIPYNNIIADFPGINYYRLAENRGPGFARQYGIDHTSEPYFMFVDCGDELLSKYSLLEVKDGITANPDYYLFFWTWINSKNKVSNKLYRSTQGWVYKRALFDLYPLRFCDDPLGGYADEDVGFNHACTTVIKSMELQDHKQYSLFTPIPIYRKIDDDNSITHTNNYGWTKHIPGLTINAIHCIKQLAATTIDKDSLIEEMSMLMFSLYRDFMGYAVQDTQYLQIHWEYIRKYYFEIYKTYENTPECEMYLSQNITRYMPTIRDKIARPNIRRFLRELNDCEQCPQFYYNLKE